MLSGSGTATGSEGFASGSAGVAYSWVVLGGLTSSFYFFSFERLFGLRVFSSPPVLWKGPTRSPLTSSLLTPALRLNWSLLEREIER